MNPQEYIKSRLNSLSKSPDDKPVSDDLANFIIKRIVSKKFRKYSIDKEFINLIESVVRNSIKQNKPLAFVWVFGGYKLFSLNSAPEVDWAELFSLIYFSEWLMPISQAYKPGIVFDFFSDDIIVPQMNNIGLNDTQNYLKSFRKLLDFVSKYLPINLRFVLNRVVDQYDNENDFQNELDNNIKNLRDKYLNDNFTLTDAQKAMISLNVKLLPNQNQDPKWMEKIQLIHDAYAMSSKRRPYYRGGDKITVLNSSVKGFLPIGTTKTSIVKFWVGIGVLQKRGDAYIENILSPKQFSKTKLDFKSIHIKGLNEKNFEKIGIIA